MMWFHLFVMFFLFFRERRGKNRRRLPLRLPLWLPLRLPLRLPLALWQCAGGARRVRA